MNGALRNLQRVTLRYRLGISGGASLSLSLSLGPRAGPALSGSTAPHGLDLLERQAFGLGHEEENKEQGGDGNAAQEQKGVRSADGGGQSEERLRDDQIRTPVGSGRDASTNAPQSQRVDLGVHRPRHGPHPRRECTDVQGQAENGHPAVVARTSAGEPRARQISTQLVHRLVRD